MVGELEPQSGSMECLVPPFRLTESANGTNGFMLVGDSGETESLSYHLKVPKVRLICLMNNNVIFILSRCEQHCSIFLVVVAPLITHFAMNAPIVCYY